MKVKTLNDFLRNVFKQLIDDGYTKRQICMLTLGAQSEPQFDGFLQGKDFGIKPLSKILDAFGYNFEIGIVKKDNIENEKIINKLNDPFLENCKSTLINSLKDQITRSTTIKSEDLDNISIEIINKLIQE